MVDFKKLGQQAKSVVDKRGGTDALKEDASELAGIAKGKGSLADKAKAAAAALKDPGDDGAEAAPAADAGVNRAEAAAGGDAAVNRAEAAAEERPAEAAAGDEGKDQGDREGRGGHGRGGGGGGRGKHRREGGEGRGRGRDDV